MSACFPDCPCDQHTRSTVLSNSRQAGKTIASNKARGFADPISEADKPVWNYDRFNRSQKRHADKLLAKGLPLKKVVEIVMKGLPK